jgi:hypothetical protein
MSVRPIAEHTEVPYDVMVIATLDASGSHDASLMNAGVPREKLFPLRQEVPVPGRPRAASDNQSNGQGE